MKFVMKNQSKQNGAATLFISVVILIIMAMMVVYAAKVGLFEQRISANDARYKDAFAIADGGLEYATQLFSDEFSRLYDGTDATTSSATLATIIANSAVSNQSLGGGTFTVTATDTGSTFGSIPVFTFSSVGTGTDTSSTATVERQITMSYLFGGTAPDVPVIVGGGVGVGGNFNVVANPDGGGDGVPVSVWSSGDIQGTNSAATCHMQYYDGNNAQCSNPSGNTENISMGGDLASLSPLASHDATVPDLLPNDPNFPSDLFNFMFGVQRADWAIKKAEAEANGQAVSSCASIVSAGTNAGVNFPLWWIDGNCDVSGATIGSSTNPVILVVDDHEFKAVGNGQVNGIVYLFENPDSGLTPTAQLGGTTEINGSFVSDVGGSAMSGSYAVVYDPNIINAFSPSDGSNYSFSYVPGSWKDF